MPKGKDPFQTKKKESKKQPNANLGTKGKNLAGQTNGQWEQNPKHGSGQFTGAGEAPLMKK